MNTSTSTPKPTAKPNLKTPNSSPGTSPLTPIFCSPYSETQCSSAYQSALDWSQLNDSASNSSFDNYNTRTDTSSTDNDELTLGREDFNSSVPNAQDMQQPQHNNKDHTILQAQVEAKSARKNDTILNTGSRNSSIIELSPFVHNVQQDDDDDAENDDDGVHETLIATANATKQQQKLQQQKLEQQKLQQLKLEQQKLQQQKLEQQKLEQQKLQQLKLEQQKLQQQKLEQQKLEQQKLEQQKLQQQKLQQQKLEQQKLQQQKLEQQKLEQQKLEQQKLEQQKLDQQKLQQEKLQQKLQQQKLQQQKLQQKLEQQKLEQQKLEQQQKQLQKQQQQQQKYKEEVEKSHLHIIDSFKSKYESDSSSDSANRTLSPSDVDDDCHEKVQLNGGGTACNADRSTKKREIKIYNTIEEFESNLPPTVTMLETPFGSKVYLVGTSHFSEESQVDVSLVIQNVRPDVVMVELCPSRIHILKLDEKTLLEEAKSFNFAKIRSIIKTNGYINGIFFMLLLQMSAQMARDLGMAPGGEFRRAFQEVHKLPGCMLHLGDRPIRITLKRALHTLSIWQTIKLMWRLTSSHTISIEEVEECKQRDLLEKVMEEVAGEFPAFSDVFVNERDIYLCHSLQLAALPQAPFDGSSEAVPVRVVGVVGIGHARGIMENWGRVDPEVIPKIMEIPPSKLSMRICKNTIKYGAIGLTMYVAFKIVRPRFLRFF